MPPAPHKVSAFITSNFRSVWDIELLCALRRHREKAVTPARLVEELRASELVVAKGLEGLLASGLIVVDADNLVRYAPVNAEMDELSEAAEQLYRRSPDAVRRMIVTAANPGLAAFADAFRLRKE
jgi:hypothetical protein